MISSRRLAREWALKILYQIDVGKVPQEEALSQALHTLRMEFAQRSSRAQKDSAFEPLALAYLTNALADVVPAGRPILAKTLAMGAARVVQQAPEWQEARFQTALRRRIARLNFDPPFLAKHIQNSAYLPTSAMEGDPLSMNYFALSDDERKRYRRFVFEASEGLPDALDSAMKSLAGDVARAVAQNRPALFQADYVLEQRIAFHEKEEARWTRIGEIVEKQIVDWLKAASFTQLLVTGTLKNVKEIDKTIGSQSAGWKLDRLVSVDHNILRLGCFELFYTPDRAAGVAINEAVELAKKYSTAESGSFVNGVLGALLAKAEPNPMQASQEIEAQEDAIDLPDELLGLEESE